eukprot:snap_masked-scaffold_80-processed-gene-0.20-mRNA-1 protein AED:1.00 eAED:1.00 QI:0/-1/0/0/-1/1/1/0/222
MRNRNNRRPTHFISIPINTPENQINFLKFKEYFLSLNNPTVHPSVFISEKKIHYTLFVLRLTSQEEIETASAVLRQVFEENPFNQFILDSDTLSCFPRMNMKHKATVFYIKPSNQEQIKTLEYITKIIAEKFFEASVITKEEFRKVISENGDVKVNFHSTIMNNKYRRGKSKVKLDLTSIFETVEEKRFVMKNIISEIALSSMSKKADPETGFYHNEAFVNL